jgi:hypothetical protein
MRYRGFQGSVTFAPLTPDFKLAEPTMPASRLIHALPGCRHWLPLVVLLLNGCAGTTRIVPPAAPLDPVPVFVVDHGLHTSLVLPVPDGSLHRYAYGDERYYALRKTGVGQALAALLWPTPGVLGHCRLPGPPSVESLQAQLRVGVREIHTLQVERTAVERLRNRLDVWIEQADRVIPAPAVDLTFVPYPQAYSLLHNSNQVVADWLRELDCSVDGRPILSGWRIEGMEVRGHDTRAPPTPPGIR